MSLVKRSMAVFAFAAMAALAQSPPRITRAVNLHQTVRLAGNTVWRAHAAVDQGAAPAGLELQHMLLLLRHSPAQEVALQQLLSAQRQVGSPQYHQWLTPAQFGAQFGPAPNDIATVEQWLQLQGFTVDGVSPGGLVIEFSGTAATVQQGLHTNIHRYLAQRPDGATQSYLANATDPAIPAALAPVVAGVVSLNNFYSQPAIQVLGQGTGHRPTPLHPAPEINFQYNGATQHALVPGDLDTIYGVNSLLTQNINGTGETIAVVARSDIDTSDFADFRNLFEPSAPANALKVVLATPGSDPGIATNGDQIEATLDTEWASAADPNATIDLVVANNSDTTDGVFLSALYIVEHNLAPIMTVSYGGCESALTSSGNQFVNDMWEQAAAEGITVLVSAGDDGAAGCDDNSASMASDGLAVSGFASTPYNTAVGGTMFNEGSNASAYWNANPTNPNMSSALGYIPEQAWNESGEDPGGGGLNAGSGGASAVYARPFWQAATGVPSTPPLMRLLPDVSLSAAGGHDGYVICQAGSCQTDSTGAFSFYVVGGTSAAAPSFAGMMALVDQKTGGRQGLANPVLYRLYPSSTSACTASGSPGPSCIFNDVTAGNTDVPCASLSPDCGSSGTLGFAAAPGYDEATGLGSVNATALVSNWGSITFAASQTSLALTPPANATVGQSVPVAITVAPAKTGGATPSGTGALLAQMSDGTTLAIATFTLGSSGTVTSSTSALPGGTYNVVAAYTGDANYGPSTSAPVSVTLAPATPTVTLQFYNYFSSQPITSLTYGDELQTVAIVSGPSGAAVATGAVTFQSSASTAAFGSATLDPSGMAAVTNTFTAPPGTYQFTAQYAGDNSYTAASSGAVSLTVTPGPTTLTVTESSPTKISVTLATQSQGPFPSVAPQVYNGTDLLGTVPLAAPTANANTGYMSAVGTFSLPSNLPSPATITVQYPGETGFAASTSNALPISTFTLDGSSPATVAAGQTATFTITATPVNGFTGQVALTCSGVPQSVTCSSTPATLDGTHPATISLSVQTLGNATSSGLPWSWPLDGRGTWLLLLALLVSAVLLYLVTRPFAARRRGPLAGIGGMTLVLLAAAACGGGSSATTPPPFTLEPSASLSPSSLQFGSIAVGQTTAAQSVALSNTGQGVLNISSLAIATGNAQDFQQTNSCGSSVAPGSKCTISVTFKPSLGSAETSALVLKDNAPGLSQSVDLSGTGLVATPPGQYTITVLGNNSVNTTVVLNVTAN